MDPNYEDTLKIQVAITQPYVPEYRVAMWEGVIARLADEDIQARVFWGGRNSRINEVRLRGDLVEPEWAEQVPTVELPTPPGAPSMIYRRLPQNWRQPRLMLTEMQVSNANAWYAIARHRPYVTMGHGTSGTTTAGAIADRLEGTLNRHADHVLTYTESGRTAVNKMSRTPLDRITSFSNATDTGRLRREMDRVDESTITIFRDVYGIPKNARIALYIGSLETYKRIDILADAAERVLSDDPSWWLVVAGAGPESKLLEALQRRSGRVIMLGRVGPDTYAPAAKLSSLILNPGRIGLIAVDALAMRLRIVTTTAAAHAPEYEYLTPEVDVVTTAPDPESFALGWLSLAAKPDYVASEVPSIDRSIETIASSLIKCSRHINGRKHF